MSPEDVTRIMDYVREYNIKPTKILGALDCPFLDKSKEKHKCMIYPARPTICRIYKCDLQINDKEMKKFKKLRVKSKGLTGTCDLQYLLGIRDYKLSEVKGEWRIGEW
jgi:hypothetical protein